MADLLVLLLSLPLACVGEKYERQVPGDRESCQFDTQSDCLWVPTVEEGFESTIIIIPRAKLLHDGNEL